MLGSPQSASTGMKVKFNNYPCTSVNNSACLTGERNLGITPPSTEVFFAGRGKAIISGSKPNTTFSYIDKWTDVHSWLDSEPPIDGDTVIIPEGQAILLDKNSPKLFLVLIHGLLEFARQDVTFDATYIWVAGGEFRVGTEEDPFLHSATITLHGDRWNTIELPFIGSKMIAVTNRGGLHGGCHFSTTATAAVAENACPVQSVGEIAGKLDLHGRPQISWTRLVETSVAGSSLLKLEEAVQWPVGSEIVITSTDRWKEEERRFVKSIQDGGFTVEVTEPLTNEHLGIWYYHSSSTPTDLRAAVGLLNKNIKIQGNEESILPGSSYYFGAHLGTFFGGEMRIENTEFTRTGQAGNMGRYSSHWHNLSPGRNVDVVDKAYLRNNSYHDTLQRATTIHGTDYAVVRDNVALKTMGHSYFTEDGDEDYLLLEHNLAVHPRVHPLLLADDFQPAGFWLPGFTGWHRSNFAANCHRGWRLKAQVGAGMQATGLTFFNNSAHACGFGWHLKPPAHPPTLNSFTGFTAFRCNTGMFYYGVGNVFHDDHRFIECGVGHFQRHISDSIWSPPIQHDMMLVGNIDNEATWSNSWQGIFWQQNEPTLFSGMKVINFHNAPVVHGCFLDMCTMRFERVQWFNSTKYSRVGDGMGGKFSGYAGIYHDLDGTFTGTGWNNSFVTMNKQFLKFPGICWEDSRHVTGLNETIYGAGSGSGLVCGKADGTARVRRLVIDEQDPWQLDGMKILVESSAGSDDLPFNWQQLYGWAIPVVAGEAFTIKVDDANNFQKLRLTYHGNMHMYPGSGNYVYQEHGYIYTKVKPLANEFVTIHMNYTDWRDHFNVTPYDSDRKIDGRMPNSGDPFGAFAHRLWPDQCAAYNLSYLPADIQQKCGNYVQSTGIELKTQLDKEPWLPQVQGRLTTVLSSKTILNQDGTYSRTADTPAVLSQTFLARECPEVGCPTPAPPPMIDDNTPYRLWSDASKWPGGTLPAETEDVTIDAEDWVIIDMETPILNWVTVIGKLEASREKNSSLNAKSVKVWGQLELGTLENPIPRNVSAEVVLHGDVFSHTVIMTEGLFLVNKVVVVLGYLSAVGTPLANSWGKLSTTADIGATSISIRGNFSAWPIGSELAIAATEYPAPPDVTESEICTISGTEFDESTNITTVTLTQALSHRHFAGVVSQPSDEANAPHVELSAAVTLLAGRSNVRFRNGEPNTEHGGVVTIGGSQDGTWFGSANISNVDFVKMGKHQYQHPALHFNFLGASQGRSESMVEGCVFSHSQSGAILLDGASWINITGNVFHRTYHTALWVGKTVTPNTVRIRGNLALETLRHPRESTAWVRPFAAFLLEVATLELSGNVAAGSTDSGFVMRPRLVPCIQGADPNPPSEANEAVGCLTSFFLLKACDGLCNECAQLRGATAWKSAHAAIITVDQTSNMRLDSIVLSDNHVGISLGFLRPSVDVLHRVFAHNITVFGSTSASTCSSSLVCKALGITDKVGATCNSVVGEEFRRAGILTYVVNKRAKLCESNPKLRRCRPPNTPVKPCVMPWDHRVGTVGSKYSESHWSGITFGHFNRSDCGWNSVAITQNPTSPDRTFPHYFSDVKWLGSVTPDARIYFRNMVGNSINRLDHCAPGNFCDALLQMSFIDVDGSFLGNSYGGGSMVPESSPALTVPSCEARFGYFACKDLKLRMLKWEALDNNGPHSDSSLGAFKISRESDGMVSWSQGPYIGECPGMQPAEKDRDFNIKPNEDYNLSFFVSPPKHHVFTFFDDDPTSIRIALRLSQPFRLEVYIGGQFGQATVLPEQTYDTGLMSPARYPTRADPHGTYAFDPQLRIFYLTIHGGAHAGVLPSRGGGKLLLRLLQVVQLSLTVSMPVTNFDSSATGSNGRSQLIDNLALLLSIPAYRIKIVSVQTRAQVAAGDRRLNSDQTALIVQIVEANPEPLPGDAFADPANLSASWTPTDEGEVTEENETSSTTTTEAVTTTTSQEQDLELAQIANTISVLSSSGDLSAGLQMPTIVDDLTVSDPTAAAASTVLSSTTASSQIGGTTATTTAATPGVTSSAQGTVTTGVTSIAQGTTSIAQGTTVTTVMPIASGCASTDTKGVALGGRDKQVSPPTNQNNGDTWTIACSAVNGAYTGIVAMSCANNMIVADTSGCNPVQPNASCGTGNCCNAQTASGTVLDMEVVGTLGQDIGSGDTYALACSAWSNGAVGVAALRCTNGDLTLEATCYPKGTCVPTPSTQVSRGNLNGIVTTNGYRLNGTSELVGCGDTFVGSMLLGNVKVTCVEGSIVADASACMSNLQQTVDVVSSELNITLPSVEGHSVENVHDSMQTQAAQNALATALATAVDTPEDTCHINSVTVMPEQGRRLFAVRFRRLTTGQMTMAVAYELRVRSGTADMQALASRMSNLGNPSSTEATVFASSFTTNLAAAAAADPSVAALAALANAVQAHGIVIIGATMPTINTITAPVNTTMTTTSCLGGNCSELTEFSADDSDVLSAGFVFAIAISSVFVLCVGVIACAFMYKKYRMNKYKREDDDLPLHRHVSRENLESPAESQGQEELKRAQSPKRWELAKSLKSLSPFRSKSKGNAEFDVVDWSLPPQVLPAR